MTPRQKIPFSVSTIRRSVRITPGAETLQCICNVYEWRQKNDPYELGSRITNHPSPQNKDAHILFEQIISFLFNRFLVHSCQYGFRKELSGETPVLCFHSSRQIDVMLVDIILALYAPPSNRLVCSIKMLHVITADRSISLFN